MKPCAESLHKGGRLADFDRSSVIRTLLETGPHPLLGFSIQPPSSGLQFVADPTRCLPGGRSGLRQTQLGRTPSNVRHDKHGNR